MGKPHLTLRRKTRKLARIARQEHAAERMQTHTSPAAALIVDSRPDTKIGGTPRSKWGRALLVSSK